MMIRMRYATICYLITALQICAGIEERLVLPYGLTLEHLKKKVYPECIKVAFDIDTVYTKPSVVQTARKVAHDVQQYGKEKLATAQEVVKTGANKVKETVEDVAAKGYNAATKGLTAAKRLVTSDVSKRIPATPNRYDERAVHMPEDIEEELFKYKTQLRDHNKKNEASLMEVPLSKKVRPGMLTVLLPLVKRGGYDVYLIGNFNPREYMRYERQYPRQSELIADTLFLKDIALTSPAFFAQMEKIYGSNIIIISSNDDVVREAARNGMIGLKFVSMRQLVADLKELGFPVPTHHHSL